jgi:hypothetical protein
VVLVSGDKLRNRGTLDMWRKGLVRIWGKIFTRAIPAVIVVIALLSVPMAVARAGELCPNEGLRVQNIWSLTLPDCRAYEQVSPVAKNLNDAYGTHLDLGGSPSGEAVTFNSTLPFPGGAGANEFPMYVSARESNGWLTQSLDPPTDVGSEARPIGLTEDLSAALIESKSEPPLSPEAVEGRQSLYLRDNATGSYTVLAQAAALEGEGFSFVGAADGDSRVFFETANRLLRDASPGKSNIYEWYDGRLSVVDVLPETEDGDVVVGGAFAGPGPAGQFYKQDVVSDEGSRISFTDSETGRIYVRDPQADPATTIAVSQGPAEWLAATPDGGQEFYIEAGQLYRFDVEGEHRERLTSTSSGTLGMLGSGGEGSYVYFAATGALAAGASEGLGRVNFYLLHDGVTSFVGYALDSGGEEGSDWSLGANSNYAGPAGGGKSSRVSSDGEALLFTSTARLTSYDNAGFAEVYLYSAAVGRLLCVSCNPTGVPPSSGGDLSTNVVRAATPLSGPPFLQRNLSEAGDRVFFESKEALVPQASNSQLNVYEWESEGTGGCPVGVGGCIYLISTGESNEPSYFAEASANGNNVFFFTRQSLVGQDADNNQDLYDARVDGGIAAQSPPAPAAPCSGEACRGAASEAPSLGPPVSQVFSGPGNLAPPPESTAATKAASKPLTGAQKLASALKACKRDKAKKKRVTCEKQARPKYGSSKRGTKSSGGGGGKS